MQPDTKAPVMDVAPPPKTDVPKKEAGELSKSVAETKPEATKNNDKVTKSKATVEKNGSSAALVVFMTIVVMIMLAGLAIYAYLKTQ